MVSRRSMPAIRWGPARRREGRPEPAPLAHTYSIVARDPATGQMGVAVQSHYFSVGPIVPWAEAGVGAVATQSLVLVDYGPRGLELMRKGMTARQALDSLLKADPQPRRAPGRDDRQAGQASPRTPVACAFRTPGTSPGSSSPCQANLMSKPTVWPEMAYDYQRAKGDLAERHAAGARSRREGGRRHSRQAVGGDADREARSPPANRGPTSSSTCASRTIPSRSRNCAAWCGCGAPTTSRTRATT